MSDASQTEAPEDAPGQEAGAEEVQRVSDQPARESVFAGDASIPAKFKNADGSVNVEGLAKSYRELERRGGATVEDAAIPAHYPDDVKALAKTMTAEQLAQLGTVWDAHAPKPETMRAAFGEVVDQLGTDARQLIEAAYSDHAVVPQSALDSGLAFTPEYAAAVYALMKRGRAPLFAEVGDREAPNIATAKPDETPLDATIRMQLEADDPKTLPARREELQAAIRKIDLEHLDQLIG